jgi:hypothetical protein
VRLVMTLAPPRRTRNDSGWVASLLPPGLSFSPLANDDGEEDEANKNHHQGFYYNFTPNGCHHHHHLEGL